MQKLFCYKIFENDDIKFKISDFSKFCNRLVSLTQVKKKNPDSNQLPKHQKKNPVLYSTGFT